MLKEITEILRDTSGLRGRQIAKKLGKDKKIVNSFLSKNHEGFIKDENSFWHLADDYEQIICLSDQTWVTADSFEEDFRESGCFFEGSASKLTIQFPAKCKILLIAGARIMALANQIVDLEKIICLDFSQCKATTRYLNRLGFFDHLDPRVEVLPKRPVNSRAQKYKGKSANLVEIAKIDLSNFDKSIPLKLTKAFTKHSGSEYHIAAFTIFSELIGNVKEHSLSLLSR